MVKGNIIFIETTSLFVYNSRDEHMLNINTLNISNVKRVEKNIASDNEKVTAHGRKWQVINRMLSLQRPYVHFLSFEIIDILLKMKLCSIDNLSNGQFELFSKFELFFVYKCLKLLLKVCL